jgi:hypothetical protein
MPPAGFGSVDDSEPDDQIPAEFYAKVRGPIERGESITDRPSDRAYPSFDWPLAAQLNNGVKVSNYIDLDPTSELLDYFGGTHTYDGHNGTDLAFYTFRQMDQGLPVLAAADGTVTGVEYSQYDRNTVRDPSKLGNYVIVRHPDGSYALYYHFRKNSVTVAVGDQIRHGQIIGLAGSSGSSSTVHLHFEPGEYINNVWNRRDPWNGPYNSSASLWKAQEAYMGDALRVFEMGAMTQASAGGDMSDISDGARKQGITQPAVFGANERYLGIWLFDQSPAGLGYDIEVLRPDGSLYKTANYTFTSKATGRYQYWYWTFNGTVSSSQYGIWTARIVARNTVLKQINFTVGASSVYGPRFSPLEGKSFRVTGSVQTDRLTLSSLGGPVTFTLVNAPSSVTLTSDTVTIGRTSTQPYRSAYFQVVATDSAGRQDTMWYHLVDPSKPFFSPQTQVAWDSPAQGSIVSGDISLQGWAALVAGSSGAAPTRVDLLVDDRIVMQLTSGGSRPDLQAYFASQGITTPANLGFAGTWNSRSVPDGTHRLTIRAGDTNLDRLEVVNEATITLTTNQNLSSTSTFNVRERGATASATSGNVSATVPGFARIQPNPGSSTPSGIAIFGYRQNNILISETAVPAAYAMQSGRIYAEVSGPVDTGIAIANPNASSATINFYFTSGTADVGAAATTIPANGQIAAFLDQAPFNAPANFQGTFTFTSSLPVGVIALRGLTNQRGEFLMSTLPVVDTNSVATTGTQVLPDFSDGGGWKTQIFLVNPGSTAMTGNIQFVSPSGASANVTIDGVTGTSFVYSVLPRGSQRFVTAGTAAVTAGGSVKIVPAGGGAGPTPLALFSYTTRGVTVTEAGVPINTASAFRMYVEASGAPDTIQTGIAVANPSGSTVPITFDLTRTDGSTAGVGTVSVNVPASGQIAKFLADIFPTLPASFTGVLRISASTAISVVGLRTRYNERGDFLITTTSPANENAPALSIERIFPHFADAGGYTTQFILFSGVSGQSSSGVLRFYSQAGQPLNLLLR